MKNTIFFGLLISMLFSCRETNTKIYIKSVQIDSARRVDWYFYSLLSNFSRSYIQVVNGKDSTDIFESFAVTDINLKGSKLSVQLFENKYKIDNYRVLNNTLTLVLDTTGGEWNDATSRLGRLQKQKVDVLKPHFAESFCPHHECY